jgi:serine/threonine protein kinase
MVFVNAIRKHEDSPLRVFIVSNIAVYREHIATADSTLKPMRSLHIGNELECCACLSDFGLTAFAGPDVTVASTTERGARRWMAPELLSPEQFNMEFKRTRESDIYTFACICCEVFDDWSSYIALMIRFLGILWRTCAIF